jgi:hypothetical protein
VGQFRVAADALADVQTVGIRQHDVQQNQIGPFAAAQLHCALAGLSSDERKPLFFKVVLK